MQGFEWIGTAVSVVLGGLSGLGVSIFKMGKYTQIVDDLKKEVSELKKEVKELSKDLTTCSTIVDERTNRGTDSSSYTKRKSPLALNEKGEDLLKKSGIDKFVLENKDELVEKIKKINPKTAYDVQSSARKVVESLAGDDRFIPFKNFAFNEGLDIDIIFTIMSIYFRDIALPLLGFQYDQIDKSDPAKTNTPKTA